MIQWFVFNNLLNLVQKMKKKKRFWAWLKNNKISKVEYLRRIINYGQNQISKLLRKDFDKNGWQKNRANNQNKILDNRKKKNHSQNKIKMK